MDQVVTNLDIPFALFNSTFRAFNLLMVITTSVIISM